MDGADDGVKMATIGLLNERYFLDFRARSRHTDPSTPIVRVSMTSRPRRAAKPLHSSRTVSQWLCELAMSGTHIRAGGKGPAPAKAERGDLQVEAFYPTPTRLASILGGLGRNISQQGCCTSIRPL
jgi:hypothetical protein